jgi:hypothetical protein
MVRLPKENVEETPWDAKTRFSRPLGGFFFAVLPHETRPRVAHNASTRTSMLLFKRLAPNDMKKGDLIAKWWIITDPEAGLMRGGPSGAGKQMRETGRILYSDKIYGE